MSDNRVQKLLFSEYCDFEDMVLIESPFAQTTKEGLGIRQVHLGLTPSKLVLATDILPPVEYVNFKYCPGVDPLIETFELIAIYPVECVNLSIYKTKKNQALKARFCNNRVLYFELGGYENRAMFWNLWCERVKFFCPSGTGSSRSETSVGTSTSGSTLYLLDRKFVRINGMKQLWCTFGLNPSLENSSINETVNTQVGIRSKWTDRHLYLGKEFECLKYAPIIEPPSLDDFISNSSSLKPSKLDLRCKNSERVSYMDEKNLSIGDSVQINRFGNGVREGCGTGLFLTVDDYVVPRRYSHIVDEEEVACKTSSSPSFSNMLNFDRLAENAVLTWEFYKATDPNKYKIRHRRRYGLATQPTFLYGFRPFEVPNGNKYSLQVKRAVSEVCLPKSTEFVTPLPKKQLTASISSQSILGTNKSKLKLATVDKMTLTYFWTPGYKYRPKTAKQFYEERIKVLKSLQVYHESLNKKEKKKKKKTKFGKNFFCMYQNKIKIPKFSSDENSTDEVSRTKNFKKQRLITGLLPYKNDKLVKCKNKETSFHCLKRSVKIDRPTCAWDFDSTTLAQQLTMIDKDLFLKITPVELEILLFQQSSQSAPNIITILAFSQRVINLLAYEVLKNDCVKTRARLISRFINVADKCHRISNFQSCKSVLSALQSPAIYRLKETWAYVRKKHASKYQNFEFLCKFYKDPRILTYQKTFFIVTHTPPFLPYMGDVIHRLLGKIPAYPFPYKMSSTRSISSITDRSYEPEQVPQIQSFSLFHKFLKAFALSQTNEARETAKRARKKMYFPKKKVRVKGLYEYYKYDRIEDNREENLEETKAFLERCQLGAMNYNFHQDEMAKYFLLKGRYKDDNENFTISLSVETPRNYYESKQNKL